VPPDTVNRAHRYALLLTESQEAAVQRQEKQLRFAWNKMVNWQRCTLRDWKYGRRSQILAELRSVTGDKEITGVAAQNANKRAAEQGITREKANALQRQEAMVKKQNYGPRRLGVVLAQEQLMSRASYFYGGQKCLLYGLVQKFKKSCENWLKLKGCAQAPQYKRQQDNVALQRQIQARYERQNNVVVRKPTAAADCRIGPESDLSSMIGQVGTCCRVVWHRPLPEEASIQQLAIAGHSSKRYLIVFFKCPRAAVLKPFGKSNSRAGIATGLKCALTALMPKISAPGAKRSR
jgi:hypothetical protein